MSQFYMIIGSRPSSLVIARYMPDWISLSFSATMVCVLSIIIRIIEHKKKLNLTL